MRLAARGTRDLGDGERPIEDQEVAAALRARGTRIVLQAAAAASVATLLTLLLPV